MMHIDEQLADYRKAKALLNIAPEENMSDVLEKLIVLGEEIREFLHETLDEAGKAIEKKKEESNA